MDAYGRFWTVVGQELLEDCYHFIEGRTEFGIKLPTLPHNIITTLLRERERERKYYLETI